MSKLFHHILVIFCICILSLSVAETTRAADLQISIEKNDTPYIYTLMLDQIEKLAGMKLTLQYPKDLLHFESATKGPAFNSFMHVVNGKNPGKLIVVMASAKGVSGTDLLLFKITFTQQQGKSLHNNEYIKPIQCQLMNDTLQEIPCDTSDYILKIPSL